VRPSGFKYPDAARAIFNRAMAILNCNSKGSRRILNGSSGCWAFLPREPSLQRGQAKLVLNV
jgi:hypothetical protein